MLAETIRAQQAPGKAARQSYSVRDAAEYLGVSKSTIDCWMQRDVAPCRRIGGRPCFCGEDLAASGPKPAPGREGEGEARHCPACGHHVLVEGRLQGTGRLYFRPGASRLWALRDGMVSFSARACAACGHIQIRTDSETLKRLRPRLRK